MAKLFEQNSADTSDVQKQESDKAKLQQQQQQYQQLQRDLADAISRLAPLDDIRILLACGARVDRPVTQGLHPIHYAAYQNFVPAARLLILRGCDLNAMDDNGYTAVHLGAERGYYDLLKFLIENGAKVCFTDVKKHGNLNSSFADEPLSMALKRGYLDCAELLLKHGADPNARYFMGSEINMVSVLKVSSIKLLLEHGAKPDTRDRSGLTPLMKAARHPQGYATVKLLIDYGADVNDIASERHDYRTVLHHSIFSGNVDLIRLLLTSGARYPRLNFDKPTPLDIAIISGRLDIARLLIEFDADLNFGQDTTIGQPLHTALTQRIDNKREIVKLLLDNGANVNSRFTSNRNTGPPLHDYIQSVRQSSMGNSNSILAASHPIENQNNHRTSSNMRSSLDLELVRTMLMYGARVLLTQRQNSQNNSYPSLVRTLERIQDELSVDLLNLLIDAAEEIDWKIMCKLIYSCLRQLDRFEANELFDPSVAIDMTPRKLALILRGKSVAHQYGLSDAIIKSLEICDSFANHSILSLKQMTRIKIRNHLVSEQLQLTGHKLIKALSNLPLPLILRKYLLYQN